MSDIVYTPVGWEDSPSTNTPINEANLGNMEQGIEDAIDGVNASIPSANILSLEDLSAVTESGKYVADALVVKDINSSLTSIDVYVGEDEKLHFVDSAGADTVLNFSSNPVLKTNLVFQWVGNGNRYTSTELVLKTACVIYFSDMSIARLSPYNADGYIQVYLNGEEIKSYELSYNNNITTLEVDDFTVSASAEDTLLIKLSTPTSASSGNVQIKLSYVAN